MELLWIVDDHCSFVGVKNSFTFQALHHRLLLKVEFLYHEGYLWILTDHNSDESKKKRKKKKEEMLAEAYSGMLSLRCCSLHVTEQI